MNQYQTTKLLGGNLIFQKRESFSYSLSSVWYCVYHQTICIQPATKWTPDITGSCLKRKVLQEDFDHFYRDFRKCSKIWRKIKKPESYPETRIHERSQLKENRQKTWQWKQRLTCPTAMNPNVNLFMEWG